MAEPEPGLYRDELGFLNPWPPEIITQYETEVLAKEGRLKDSWLKYIEGAGGIDKVDIRSSQFKKMVRSGIPSALRPLIWGKITGVSEKLCESPDVYNSMRQLRDAVPANVKRVISIDVPRTFTGATGFTSEKLESVLLAFALARPDIGYCQSLNYIAAVLIAVVGEEPGFWMLCTIVDKYLPPNYYCQNMEGFQVDLMMMESLFCERVPEIARHAQRLKHEWMLTVSGWMLTLFANSFPVVTVVRIWDSFLLEGAKVIFRVSIAFMRLYYNDIISTEQRATLNRRLAQIQAETVLQDRLMELSFKIKAFSRKHLVDMRTAARDRLKGAKETKHITRTIQALLGQLNM